MKKTIKPFTPNCGIAKQVAGKIVDAEKDKQERWHFTYENEKYVASDYAFVDGE